MGLAEIADHDTEARLVSSTREDIRIDLSARSSRCRIIIGSDPAARYRGLSIDEIGAVLALTRESVKGRIPARG